MKITYISSLYTEQEHLNQCLFTHPLSLVCVCVVCLLLPFSFFLLFFVFPFFLLFSPIFSLFPFFFLRDLQSDAVYSPTPGASTGRPGPPFPYAPADGWTCIVHCRPSYRDVDVFGNHHRITLIIK